MAITVEFRQMEWIFRLKVADTNYYDFVLKHREASHRVGHLRHP